MVLVEEGPPLTAVRFWTAEELQVSPSPSQSLYARSVE